MLNEDRYILFSGLNVSDNIFFSGHAREVRQDINYELKTTVIIKYTAARQQTIV